MQKPSWVQEADFHKLSQSEALQLFLYFIRKKPDVKWGIQKDHFHPLVFYQ